MPKGKKGKKSYADFDDDMEDPNAEPQAEPVDDGGDSGAKSRKQKQLEKKAKKDKKKGGGGGGGKKQDAWGDGEPEIKAEGGLSSIKTVTKLDTGHEEDGYREMTASSVLASAPNVKDIVLDGFSISFMGHQLLKNTRLELYNGRRYGLVGENGTGKSTLLCALSQREVEYPEHIDVFHLVREVAESDSTPMEIVSSCDEERVALEEEAERMASEGDGIEDGRLDAVYERLDELDVNLVEKRAGEILNGLGFTLQTINKKARDFSGGWRMRISLARALFVSPQLLLLDEPTNHLDMESCIWLESTLGQYKRTLVIISHSQDFMNGVCTNMIHMHNARLNLFNSDYDGFVRQRAVMDEAQAKKFESEQDQIVKLKQFVAEHSSGKQAKQAQSKQKQLDRMLSEQTEEVVLDTEVKFNFFQCGKLPPPVLGFDKVAFHYPSSPDKMIYDSVDAGIHCDSRLALVGPNGAGKSTLLKLMAGKLEPTDGRIARHRHLKLGIQTQHSTDMLDLDQPPCDWMLSEFPPEMPAATATAEEHAAARREAGQHENRMRSHLGSFGIKGANLTTKMRHLSDGQKSRVCFAHMARTKPHIILLDEPTNHLDIDSIDALAEAIKRWDGGVVLVSHDFRLIGQVATEIWECRDGAVIPWKKDILAFKHYFREKYTPSVEGAKLVNREGGGGGLDDEEGDVLSLAEKVVELNYGGEDGKKKATPTNSGKRKQKKGAFGKGGRAREDLIDAASAGGGRELLAGLQAELDAAGGDEEEVAEAVTWWLGKLKDDKPAVLTAVWATYMASLSPLDDGAAVDKLVSGPVPAAMLAPICRSTEGQKALLDIAAAHAVKKGGDLLARLAHLFKALYDAELVDEDVLMAWVEAPDQFGLQTEARTATAGFFKWLRTAEVEEEDN